jgi:hypothetical protein
MWAVVVENREPEGDTLWKRIEKGEETRLRPWEHHKQEIWEKRESI